jgi:cyclopropane fatty-acyl-phospholipid synthase-like methyltransferase
VIADDIFGRAIQDYFSGYPHGKIHTLSSLEEEDHIPVSYLFRDFDAMPELEKHALGLCRGRVLDIGCGAGSHSLYLTGKGFEVTSLDTSQGAVEVCRMRGLKDVVQTDFLSYSGRLYDTLLLLMNGIGIAGELAKLPGFLKKAKALLNPGGQILFDSSDIIYMFDIHELDAFKDTYYGEVVFQIRYKDLISLPFQWLYIDYNTIEKVAKEQGFSCELVRKGDHYDYLAKLTLSG